MKIEKVEKLVVNLLDKTEYVIHIRNLKQFGIGFFLSITLETTFKTLHTNKLFITFLKQL